MSWWRAHNGYGWGCSPAEGPHGGGPQGGGRHGFGRHGHGHGGDDDGAEGEGFGGGAFGVRRPLRFLAYKLELDEKQVTELARVLDELKTERAQAEVDRRRSLSGFADAVAGAEFDAARAKDAAALRVATAERLRDAVTAALGRLHALLDNDQRERLAYLIRTGVLAL
ncbi:MAG TPA: Spy/CpxP family protein refolding chaperone [Polyangia bacterium]|nr:Spy/CpxP family protein refolding chaperone [Polyangia bacterium]